MEWQNTEYIIGYFGFPPVSQAKGAFFIPGQPEA